MKRPILAVAAVGVVTMLTGCVPAAGTVPRDSLADGIAQSDDLLSRLLADHAPGCSGAVTIDGGIAWAGARGMADLDTGKVMTTATIFDIASVSKQFTATAILLLEQDGSLGLDDVLSAHVDGLPLWADEVTLRQLLHHTTGIPDYTGLLIDAGTEIEEAASQEDALAAIASVATLPDGADSTFAYSNSNYILLAEVAEVASGIPLPQFLAERVFEPLALNMRLEPGFSSPDVAIPFARQDGTFIESGSLWTQIGDGSVYTTPSELARWAGNYRSGPVGGEVLLKATTQDAVATGSPDGSRYGAGIQIGADGALSHLGGWAGYVTVFGVTADRSTAIVLSCNSPDVAASQVAEGLLTIWAG
jgi:CubicO group peptidase (beta-lactamase class C family)